MDPMNIHVKKLPFFKHTRNDDNDIGRRKQQKLDYQIFTCKFPISYITMSADHDIVMKLCRKKQNGGRRHLELLFRNPGPPTKSTSWPEHCVKILFQSHYYFPRYIHLKILQIWLKTPIPAPNICVFGFFLSPDIIFRHRYPQKAHPWANPRRSRYTS